MRKKRAEKRYLNPDPKFNDILVAKFVNNLMYDGKKDVARQIVYEAFEIIKKQTQRDPLEVFQKALENSSPSVEVRPQRVGGATYQVPRPVTGKRQTGLAIRWIIETAKKKKGKPMKEKLAQELILASKNEGDAVKKKINTHRMAAANRAFAYLAR